MAASGKVGMGAGWIVVTIGGAGFLSAVLWSRRSWLSM